MRRVGMMAVGLALAGVVAFPTTAHGAPWVREPVFTDRAGVVNGCTAHVDLGVDATQATVPGQLGLHAAYRISCPVSADVHRLVYAIGLDKIRADGSVETVFPLVQGYRSGSGPPFEFNDGSAWWPCSTPGLEGTHQFRYRMEIKTKQSLDNSDPNPFVGRMQIKRRLTCPA